MAITSTSNVQLMSLYVTVISCVPAVFNSMGEQSKPDVMISVVPLINVAFIVRPVVSRVSSA